MSLEVYTTMQDGLGTVYKAIVATTADDYKYLQELVQRGANLWPDAPPQVKRVADLVTSGKVLQDYGPDH